MPGKEGTAAAAAAIDGASLWEGIIDSSTVDGTSSSKMVRIAESMIDSASIAITDSASIGIKFQQENRELREDIKVLETENRSRKEENDILQDMVRQLEKENEELEVRYRNDQEEILELNDALTKRIADLESDKKSLEKKIVRLEDENMALRNALDKSVKYGDAREKDLQVEVDKLEWEFSVLRKENNRLGSEVSVLHEMNEKLEGQLVDTTTERNTLQEQLREVRKENTCLKKVNATLEKEMAKVSNKTAHIEENRAQTIKEKEKQWLRTMHEKDELYLHVTAQKNHLQRQLKEKEDERAELQLTHTQKVRQYEETIGTLKESVTKLQESNNKLQESNTKLEERNKEAKHQNMELEKQNAALFYRFTDVPKKHQMQDDLQQGKNAKCDAHQRTISKLTALHDQVKALEGELQERSFQTIEDPSQKTPKCHRHGHDKEASVAEHRRSNSFSTFSSRPPITPPGAAPVERKEYPFVRRGHSFSHSSSRPATLQGTMPPKPCKDAIVKSDDSVVEAMTSYQQDTKQIKPKENKLSFDEESLVQSMMSYQQKYTWSIEANSNLEALEGDNTLAKGKEETAPSVPPKESLVVQDTQLPSSSDDKMVTLSGPIHNAVPAVSRLAISGTTGTQENPEHVCSTSRNKTAKSESKEQPRAGGILVSLADSSSQDDSSQSTGKESPSGDMGFPTLEETNGPPSQSADTGSFGDDRNVEYTPFLSESESNGSTTPITDTSSFGGDVNKEVAPLFSEAHNHNDVLLPNEPNLEQAQPEELAQESPDIPITIAGEEQHSVTSSSSFTDVVEGKGSEDDGLVREQGTEVATASEGTELHNQGKDMTSEGQTHTLEKSQEVPLQNNNSSCQETSTDYPHNTQLEDFDSSPLSMSRSEEIRMDSEPALVVVRHSYSLDHLSQSSSLDRLVDHFIEDADTNDLPLIVQNRSQEEDGNACNERDERMGEGLAPLTTDNGNSLQPHDSRSEAANNEGTPAILEKDNQIESSTVSNPAPPKESDVFAGEKGDLETSTTRVTPSPSESLIGNGFSNEKLEQTVDSLLVSTVHRKGQEGCSRGKLNDGGSIPKHEEKYEPSTNTTPSSPMADYNETIAENRQIGPGCGQSHSSSTGKDTDEQQVNVVGAIGEQESSAAAVAIEGCPIPCTPADATIVAKTSPSEGDLDASYFAPRDDLDKQSAAKPEGRIAPPPPSAAVGICDYCEAGKEEGTKPLEGQNPFPAADRLSRGNRARLCVDVNTAEKSEEWNTAFPVAGTEDRSSEKMTGGASTQTPDASVGLASSLTPRASSRERGTRTQSSPRSSGVSYQDAIERARASIRAALATVKKSPRSGEPLRHDTAERERIGLERPTHNACHNSSKDESGEGSGPVLESKASAKLNRVRTRRSGPRAHLEGCVQSHGCHGVKSQSKNVSVMENLPLTPCSLTDHVTICESKAKPAFVAILTGATAHAGWEPDRRDSQKQHDREEGSQGQEGRDDANDERSTPPMRERDGPSSPSLAVSWNSIPAGKTCETGPKHMAPRSSESGSARDPTENDTEALVAVPGSKIAVLGMEQNDRGGAPGRLSDIPQSEDCQVRSLVSCWEQRAVRSQDSNKVTTSSRRSRFEKAKARSSRGKETR